jgi:AraC-like DNA-binding protein
LLSGGGFTIQEISAKCGYANTNSFYKTFKKYYGFSPGKILNNNTKPGNDGDL